MTREILRKKSQSGQMEGLKLNLCTKATLVGMGRGSLNGIYPESPRSPWEGGPGRT